MEIPHREIATIHAAKLVVTNLMGKLKHPETPLKEVREAIIPLFGIRWDLNVVRGVGSSLLRHILWSLRNSELSVKEYNQVSRLWKDGVANSGEFPLAWESWRTLIERFNLDDNLKLEDWIVVIDSCIKSGWKEPYQLAKIDAETFRSFQNKNSLPEISNQLWKAAILLHAECSAGASLALKGASGDAELLLTRLKAVSLADSAIRTDVSESLHKLKLPKSFSELGPTAKLAKLRQASVDKGKIKQFFRTASHMNALAGVRFCFQSFASALRCYYIFCELRGNPTFPVTEAIVLEWSSLFNPGGTFRNYVNYLKKSLLLPGFARLVVFSSCGEYHQRLETSRES